jgi:tripartite-type tricarboxylate transporter receptor subunit TctC
MNQRNLRRSLLACVMGAAALVLSSLVFPVYAQYPNKPIRLIVPFPAGGATDSAARELGEGLSRLIGQPVLVENRPGADGAIAAQAVISAAADGYTLLFGSSSMEGIPFVQKSAPFATLNDFTPVSLVCRLAFGMVVSPGVAAKSVPEFITFARANPDKLNYGSGSLSEMFAASQFMRATNTRLVKVNYKGGAAVIPDLANDRVQVSFGPLSPMLPLVREGRLNVLAVLLDKRAAAVPDAPSLSDLGIKGLTGAGGLQAVFAPPATSAEIIERLGAAIRTVMSDANVRAKLVARGQEPETSTPQALAAMIRSEHAGWVRFAADEGLKPE